MAPAEVPEEHRAFADRVDATRMQDPMPTFRALSETTRIPVEKLIHYALVRWAASGSEALMAVEPQTLRDLVDARRREDWEAVAGIVDWLAAGNPPGA
jgi:type II secretory pathway component PulK